VASFNSERSPWSAHRHRKTASQPFLGAISLPKRNYGYEKRQKELTRQRKQEEKRQRRLERTDMPAEDAKLEDTSLPDTPLEE
jgi:hypothetical protein